MEQQTTEPTVESSVTWERLEARLRGRMRQWIQELLEAEVDDLLGCPQIGASEGRGWRPGVPERARQAEAADPV